MHFTHLLLNSEDGITTITINRPQRAIEAFWARRGKR